MLSSLKTNRLASLDVFRGVTVILMIIANSSSLMPGYACFRHVEWNGCSLADLVFPFFIFIVGMSTVFSLSSKKNQGMPKKSLLVIIVRRAVILFGIGLFLNAFPYTTEWANLRLMGVLQRIAICYLVAAYCYLYMSMRTQLVLVLVILVGYWALLTQVFVPGHGPNQLTPEGNFAGYIDGLLMSSGHLFHHEFDPEGLFSSVSAIATALFGNLTAMFWLSPRKSTAKMPIITLVGVLLSLSGWVWGLSFPINKSLWTGSYVLWSAGLGVLLFALIECLVNIKCRFKWFALFELFGVNALAAFVLHVLGLKIQARLFIMFSHRKLDYFQSVIMREFNWFSPNMTAFFYGLCYVLLCAAVMWFISAQDKQ